MFLAGRFKFGAQLRCALNSIICTRLYTFTAPSPEVSIGRRDALAALGLRTTARRPTRPTTAYSQPRFDRQRHCGLLVLDVHHQLADFHVAFAAAQVVVV